MGDPARTRKFHVRIACDGPHTHKRRLRAGAYRLIKFADARRVLFLVDRANLGRQTLKEFQAFTTPGRRAQVHRALQRPAPALERDRPGRAGRRSRRSSGSTRSSAARRSSTPSSTSTPPTTCCRPSRCRSSTTRGVPIETFDVVIVDECHRSIYGLWRQVLDYFDAFIDRPDRDAEQADVRLLQPEPRDGVHATSRPSPTASTSTSTSTGSAPRSPSRAARSTPASSPQFRDRQTRAHALGEARRGRHLRRRGARPRRRRQGPDPHRHPDVQRAAVHRDLPRPQRGAEDADLRQGRLARRRHRPDRPRGVRQGQRLRRQDHLQVDRPQARRPDRDVPQLLQPADRRHRRHDRHRHRRAARSSACSSCARSRAAPTSSR